MCDLDAVGAPSILRLIRSVASLERMLPILDLSCEENAARRKWKLVSLAELLKLQESGQFPDEPAKIKGAHIHHVNAQTH